MLNTFLIILPVFLLIGLGFVAVRSKLVEAAAIPGVGKLVLFFFLPATIFTSLQKLDFAQALELHYVAGYAAASLGVLIGLFVARRWLFGDDAAAAAIKGLGASLPNSMFIGFPILLLCLPETATIAFVMALLVENILTLPLALILLEYAAGRSESGTGRRVWYIVGRRIMTNPLIWAIVAGVLASLLGLTLPGVLDQSLDMLKKASGTLALLFIGMSLATNTFRGNVHGLTGVVLGKLVLHPLLAALLVFWILPGFDPSLQQSMVVIAAGPMLAIYPIIGDRFGFRAFCSNTLLVATVAGMVSLTLVLTLLGL
ncbi:MAG: AEC family transporter [Thiothrix sp.]|nr:AEC family transporter [Thiothrix sp.]HPQ94648.1 AEC family transporter [Thiolinea sp.]